MTNSAREAAIFDVFICHASEDKEQIARPLARKLAERNVKAWLDEQALTLGDLLHLKIDEGLSRSRYGIVVLSPAFFSKHWPQVELDSLAARESSGAKVILPVWHKLTASEVGAYSPLLAGRIAVSTDSGLDHVVDEVVRAIETSGSTSSFAHGPEPNPTPSEGPLVRAPQLPAASMSIARHHVSAAIRSVGSRGAWKALTAAGVLGLVAVGVILNRPPPFPPSGPHRCSVDGRELAECRVEPAEGGSTIVIRVSPDPSIVHHFRGSLDMGPRRGCVRSMLTSHFSTDDDPVALEPAGELMLCFGDGDQWRGTWTDSQEKGFVLWN